MNSDPATRIHVLDYELSWSVDIANPECSELLRLRTEAEKLESDAKRARDCYEERLREIVRPHVAGKLRALQAVPCK